MSQVITHPQATAAPIAEAAAQTAGQSWAHSQARAPSSLVALSALAIVEQVRLDHMRAMDSENISAHCLTLVELAEKTLQQLVTAETADAGLENVVETLAFEAAALLAGALAWDVKDSPKATSRHELVEQAYRLMDEAAMSFGLEGAPCVALAVGVQAGVAASRRRAYTVQQLHDALALIANRSNTLEQILMGIGERCTDRVQASELATNVDAATIIINSIGGVADEACGGMICGDWEAWTFGPLFEDHGKAVQS